MTRASASQLVTLVNSCVVSGIHRQALMLRMDRLPPAFPRPRFLRLAEAALQPMLAVPRAQLFHLDGPRLAVVWRGDAEGPLLEVVDALKHLLEDSLSPALPDLLALYDFPEHADLFLAAMADEEPAAEAPPGEEPGPPLDPALLTLLEASLAQADVARFARRQSVWWFDGDIATLAWEERTLSMHELADGLVPGHDLKAEPWLFRRLTRTLDRRLLALLSSPGELAGAGPFEIDLNVASLLSNDFLRFDASLPPGLRGRVVVGLAPADVVADARSFSFARGFANARGYPLMLRDATPALLQVLSPIVTELDYLSLPWSRSLPDESAALLEACPPGQLILSGCDTRAALVWGQKVGIGLFTGPVADRVALGERAAAA